MDEIVDVAMDEDIARLEFEQRRLRATGIGTADPNGSGIVLQTWCMEQRVGYKHTFVFWTCAKVGKKLGLA